MKISRRVLTALCVSAMPVILSVPTVAIAANYPPGPLTCTPIDEHGARTCTDSSGTQWDCKYVAGRPFCVQSQTVPTFGG